MANRFGVNTILATLITMVAFWASLQNNTLGTSLIRAASTFILIFLLAIPVQWILRRLLALGEEESVSEAIEAEEMKGNNIDLTTPEDEEGAHFQPLDLSGLTQLSSKSAAITGDESTAVEAVRHLMK